MFDPNTFLESTTTESLDTHLPPCPIGKWLFECTDVKARGNPQVEKDPTAAALILDFIWQGRDEGLLEAAGRDRVQVRHSVFVTTVGNTIETGEGKNTRLGAVRAAVGQNIPGEAWGPRMVIGCTAKLTIGHKPDKNDPEKNYDQVNAIEAPYES